ncbi:MAG: DNA repair protein RadA [Nitrospirae bacterium]|nr:DNA repair protein RadA [Nitrospirota bacterium]
MAKTRTIFACQNCGAQSPKWLGRCPDCGAWNSMAEERVERSPPPPPGGGRSAAVPLPSVEPLASGRISTGIGELDRVLGGGIVPGSLILIGGDPGIGKSTLILQAAASLADDERTGDARPVLYVTGEESPQQIALRAARLGVSPSRLLLLAETNLAEILRTAEACAPQAMVIDSIQTTFLDEISSAPGSISQVREAAGRILMFAKPRHLPVFLIGHVTKDGSIAGPRVLEHIVDTVLYFEGDRGQAFRIVRAVKNRFGSTNEIGVFEMKGEGLSPVANPSALFLSERPDGSSGSVVAASMEGNRPILVELQALVTPTAYGTPRRSSIGVDPARVSLLLAVLEKRAGLPLIGQDVFVNVVGGIQLDEPAADLAVVAAVASSMRERAVDPRTVVFGEVGLAGEVRAVAQVEARLSEAAKLGFTRCIVPRGNREKIAGVCGVELVGVSDVREAVDAVLG